MLRLWETIGQAVLDPEFRRDHVLLGKDEELPAGYSAGKLHDRVNIPERHAMSRFEVAEVGRLFSIREVVNGIIKVCEQWQEYRSKENLVTKMSAEFNRALGLAVSDTTWVKVLTGPDPDNASEQIHFDLTYEEKGHLRSFLKYAPNGKGGRTTAELLGKIEAAGWSDDCPNSASKSLDYFTYHPKPPYRKKIGAATGG